MSTLSWKVLDQISGMGRAEILKGLLEAQGIKVVLSQEGIGESAFPVTVGPLSETQILVPEDQLEDAQKVLEEYEAGEFENTPRIENPEGESDQSSNQG